MKELILKHHLISDKTLWKKDIFIQVCGPMEERLKVTSEFIKISDNCTKEEKNNVKETIMPIIHSAQFFSSKDLLNMQNKLLSNSKL